MLDELLREIVTITVGKGAEPIADLLHSNKHQNEFTIAKKLGITINQTRNILYKISDYSLVSSERKKDKKKGWYTYYWRFDIKKCLEFLKKRLLESKERFETQISRREEKQYYICEDCNLEYSEDEALLMNFECDECGELFTVKDNTKLLQGLNKNLERIQLKLADIEVELEKEQKKLDRKKAKILKAEEEEKERKKEEAKKKRAAKKAERDALKAKENEAKEKEKAKKAKEKEKLKKEKEKEKAKKAKEKEKLKKEKEKAKKVAAKTTKKKVEKKSPKKTTAKKKKN